MNVSNSVVRKIHGFHSNYIFLILNSLLLTYIFYIYTVLKNLLFSSSAYGILVLTLRMKMKIITKT